MEGSRVEALLVVKVAVDIAVTEPGSVMLRPLAVLTLASAVANLVASLLSATNVLSSVTVLMDVAIDRTKVTFAALRSAAEDVMETPDL